MAAGAIDAVVAAVPDQLVARRVSGGADRGRAKQRGCFDLAFAKRSKIDGHHRLDSIVGIFAALLVNGVGCHAQEIEVIAGTAAKLVGAGAAIEDVIADSSAQNVVSGA